MAKMRLVSGSWVRVISIFTGEPIDGSEAFGLSRRLVIVTDLPKFYHYLHCVWWPCRYHPSHWMETAFICTCNQRSLSVLRRAGYDNSWYHLYLVDCSTTFKDVFFLSDFCSLRKFLFQFTSPNNWLRVWTSSGLKHDRKQLSFELVGLMPKLFYCPVWLLQLSLINIWHIFDEVTRFETCSIRHRSHRDELDHEVTLLSVVQQ